MRAPGRDTFTDLAGLKRFMSAPTIPVVAGQVPPPSSGLRAIHAADVNRFRPVHKGLPAAAEGPATVGLAAPCTKGLTSRSVMG